MATRAILDYTTAATGLCAAVVDKLDELGLITTVHSKSYSTAIFSSPLLPDGYAMRFACATGYTGRIIGVAIGTYVGSTWTTTKTICDYVNTTNDAITALDFFYDSSLTWFAFVESTAANTTHLVYVGCLDNSEKIAFACSRWNGSKGVISLVAPPIDLGNIVTFNKPLSTGGLYLEQPVYLTDSTKALILNGANPAYVVGIKNVAILYGNYFIGPSWALMGGQYLSVDVSASGNNNTYLKIDIG